MASIRCPLGCRWVRECGNLVMENRDVVIFGDICDRPEKCGRKDCRYWDDSPEATRRFIREQCWSRTPGGIVWAAEYERTLRKRHGQEKGKAG